MEERDEHSRTFANPDGSYSKQQGFFPLHFKRDGYWVSYDKRLIYSPADPDLIEIAGTDHPLKVNVRSGRTEMYLTKSEKISFGQNSRLEFTDAQNHIIYSESYSGEKPHQLAGNNLLIKDLFHQVDRSQNISFFDLETDYVLKSKPTLAVPDGKVVFTEKIVLPEGWRVERNEGDAAGNEWNGSLRIVDGSGEIQATIAAIVCYDNSGVRGSSISGTYLFYQTGNVVELKTCVNASWLLSNERAYPVTIDPTINGVKSQYGSVRNGALDASCQETMAINIPYSSISSTSTTYSIQSVDNSYGGEQNSRVGAIGVMAVVAGSGTGYLVTNNYSFTGLTIANTSCWTAGNMTFYWQGRDTYRSNNACSQTNMRRINNWEVIVTYTLLNSCSIGAETAAYTAPSGCTSGTVPLGSGAYKDVSLAANTYYNFTWTDSPQTSGFCATVSGSTGATSTSFSTNQTNWYSGSTASTIRISASRSSCTWTTNSAVMTYTNAINNPGAISVPSSICAGVATNISNVTAAYGGPSAVNYYFYYRGGPSNVSWTMYDGPTTNTSSALPAAVINTPGTWYIARNSDFGCGQANNGTTVDLPITVTAGPTLGTLSNAGPVNFCDVGGNFTTPLTVSGQNGTVYWDWGSNNGVWNNNWLTGVNSGVSIFPKKTSGSDGNADRIRYRVTIPGCTDVTSSTILIVNKFNEAPSTLTSSSTALCSTTGGNITLTATFPASINKNGSVAFYSGSCGGTLLGTVTAGDNTSTAQYVIPAPTSTTTYYARYEPGTGASCSNSTCVSVTVNVGTPSTAPTAISGSGVTVCHGNTVSLSPTGGALGAGASYEWFSGSCGGTAVGTGNSISVSPTGTTTYYVRAGAGTYCPATACASGTITLPAAGTGLATGGQSATCNVSGSNWIHFYHSSGNLIASINPNGNNLGSVTATAFVSGGAQLTQACGTGSNPSFTTAALGRSWLITPTNNLPASVRFPFSSAELSSLITASAGTTSNSLDNVAAIGDIKMSHYSGPANLNGSWSDNCVSAGGSGGTQLIGSQAGNGAVTTANGFPATVSASSYIQFNTPGFSEFWLHGNGGSSPLPVQLTSFSATCMESGKANIHWSTASEQNSQKFIIERSRDLSQWTQAGEQAAAGNSNYAIDYVAEDLNPFGGISYYRLVQVDNDGAERIYGPVSVSCGEKQNSMSVFPNPNKGAFTVEVTSDENVGTAEVQLVDLTGKVIAGKPVTIYEGQNQILFDDIELQQGTYIVRMISKNDIKPVRVVVN